jgi:hypothetical protein
MEVLLLADCGGMLVLMCGEISRKLGWIGWIGTETQAADRTGIFTGPYAFALPARHYRPKADFFGGHCESLHRFHRLHWGKSFKLTHYQMLISVEFHWDIR